MMKKIFLVLGLLFVLGCQPSDLTVVDYFTGREGVHVAFAQNSPPNTVFETTPMSIGVNLHNRGAHDTQGIVIFEYDTFLFEGSGRLTSNFELSGKQPIYPRGEIGFTGLAPLRINQIEGLRQAMETQITASVCYPYKTTLTDNFCVDSDIFGIGQNSVCRQRERHTYNGQGAPLVITSIIPMIVPRGFDEVSQTTAVSVLDNDGVIRELDIQNVNNQMVILQPVFEITVRNVGSGQVFGASSLSACTNVRERRNGELMVRARLLGIELDCGTRNPVLINNEANFRCVVSDEDLFVASSSYQEVLTVEIDYYYIDQVSKKVVVERLR